MKTIESHEGWDNKPQTEYTKIQIHCNKPQKRGQPRKVQQTSKNSQTAKSAANQRKFKKSRKVQQTSENSNYKTSKTEVFAKNTIHQRKFKVLSHKTSKKQRLSRKVTKISGNITESHTKSQNKLEKALRGSEIQKIRVRTSQTYEVASKYNYWDKNPKIRVEPLRHMR